MSFSLRQLLLFTTLAAYALGAYHSGLQAGRQEGWVEGWNQSEVRAAHAHNELLNAWLRHQEMAASMHEWAGNAKDTQYFAAQQVVADPAWLMSSRRVSCALMMAFLLTWFYSRLLERGGESDAIHG